MRFGRSHFNIPPSLSKLPAVVKRFIIAAGGGADALAASEKAYRTNPIRVLVRRKKRGRKSRFRSVNETITPLAPPAKRRRVTPSRAFRTILTHSRMAPRRLRRRRRRPSKRRFRRRVRGRRRRTRSRRRRVANPFRGLMARKRTMHVKHQWIQKCAYAGQTSENVEETKQFGLWAGCRAPVPITGAHFNEITVEQLGDLSESHLGKSYRLDERIKFYTPMAKWYRKYRVKYWRVSFEVRNNTAMPIIFFVYRVKKDGLHLPHPTDRAEFKTEDDLGLTTEKVLNNRYFKSRVIREQYTGKNRGLISMRGSPASWLDIDPNDDSRKISLLIPHLNEDDTPISPPETQDEYATRIRGTHGTGTQQAGRDKLIYGWRHLDEHWKSNSTYVSVRVRYSAIVELYEPRIVIEN